MKKNLMIFAASTMLLFAACNKEEVSGNGYTINGNKITFGMGMQSSDDKQGFHGSQKKVFFSSTDQIYVNGLQYDVDPVADPDVPGTNDNYSSQARVTCDLATDGRYEFMYPYHTLQHSGSNYTATFPANVQALDGNINNMMDASIIAQGRSESVPIIPMYFVIPNINQFNGNVVLKNTVAFLAPNILYGDLWANKVFKPLTDITYDAQQQIARPIIHLLDGRIKANFRLTGAATLVADADDPIMVYDNPLGSDEWDVVRFRFPNGAQLDAGQENYKLAGMIPIAPVINPENGPAPERKMRIAFTMTVQLPSATSTNLETYYMCYMSEVSTLRDGTELLRNTRNDLRVNFNENRCTYTDGLDNYTTNRGGEIVFQGGNKLFISNSQSAINTWMQNNIDTNF